MVIKVIELVGESPKSWEAATQEAVSKAGKTVKEIVGVDVVGHTAVVKKGKITKYRADVKIGFVVK